MWLVWTERGLPWQALEATQESLAARVRAEPAHGYLLLSEPRATYTGGRNAAPAGLLWSDDERMRRDIATAPVGRGGQWTYHGPGQCLLYPIVSLEALGYSRRSVRAFAGDLRHGVAVFLQSLGVAAEEREEPFGVYVDGAKIAAFGLAVRHGIVTHGVALYLESQREPFLGIHPCGVPNAPVTSLAELGLRLTWTDAAAGLAEAVKNVLKPFKSC